MRSDRQLEVRTSPLTIERALTSLIQGRNSIEKAHRDVADALRILSHLQARSANAGWDTQAIRRLRRALDQLDASRSQLRSAGLEVSAAPSATVSDLA